MDIAARLTKDVAELAHKLRKFYAFYYELIEAKQIHLNFKPDFRTAESIDIIQVDKAEWERWQKIKKMIDDFEVP